MTTERDASSSTQGNINRDTVVAPAMIPRSHPEELNNVSLVDRLNRLEKKQSDMQELLDRTVCENLLIKEKVEKIPTSTYADKLKSGVGTFGSSGGNTRLDSVLLTSGSNIATERVPEVSVDMSEVQVTRLSNHTRSSSRGRGQFGSGRGRGRGRFDSNGGPWAGDSDQDVYNDRDPSVPEMSVDVSELQVTSLSNHTRSSSRGRGQFARGGGRGRGRYGRNGGSWAGDSDQDVYNDRDPSLDRYSGTSAVSRYSVLRVGQGDKSQDSEGFRIPKYVLKKQQQQSSRRHKIITGSANQRTGTFKGAPEPNRDLFIFRVMRDATVDDMKQYLASEGFHVKSLHLVSHPESKFQSFRLSVPASEFKDLFNDTLWPEGVRIRRYVPRRNEADSQ